MVSKRDLIKLQEEALDSEQTEISIVLGALVENYEDQEALDLLSAEVASFGDSEE